MSKPSPFNGRWVLTYASDFEEYMDAFECSDPVREMVRKTLSVNHGPNQLYEEYFIDNEAGTISRKVFYPGSPNRESTDVKFDEFHTATSFDGDSVRYMYGREGSSDNVIVRFEIGHKNTVHSMIVSEVHGDLLLRTYTCRGRTYIKKFMRIKQKAL